MPGGTWGIRWREGARRKFRGGFESRELADRVLARIASEVGAPAAAFGVEVAPKSIATLQVYAEDLLERRKATHRAADMDRVRWHKHLAPHFGHLKPADVDTARIRRFVETGLADGKAGGSLRICVALLSSLYVDLMERRLAQHNPARGLPRSLLRLMKSKQNPEDVPFIETLTDVQRIYATLMKPMSIAYAIGALAGLRTGEVFALRWANVNLKTRRIFVRESVDGPLKDKEPRTVPIVDGLLTVLERWREVSPGLGLVVPPLRRDGKHVHKTTPGRHLRRALKKLGIEQPGLGWYEATRHTFASQWVLAGNTIEKLQLVMGHSSIAVTMRYVHLRPRHFDEGDLSAIKVELTPPRPGAQVASRLQIGQTLGNQAPAAPTKSRRTS